VRRELVAGELVAHPIIEPTIARRLYMIYSADRSLIQPERELVQMLRAHLADDAAAPVQGGARKRSRAVARSS
jgi:hypothetical protein